MPGLYDVSRQELGDLLEGEPGYRVEQVWDGLYRRARRPGELTELPVALRARLDAELLPSLTEDERLEADRGTTVKWRWRLDDGALVETVLMTYADRVTVCVSSQAGCAMACQFCATGQAGFARHLRPGEMVEQVQAARRRSGDRRVTNVVFMGMGEPLANYERVMAAIGVLHGDVGISARHLTLSTVGIVPGIRRLAAEPLPVNLAVSLHAARDELRDRLVPVNRRYPLAELASACAGYVAGTRRRLSLEWALIDDVNDASRDADELAAFARPLAAHVNLIPLNPTPGYPVVGTPTAQVARFADRLRRAGVTTTVRRTRGRSIDAACGQLAASPDRRRGTRVPFGVVRSAVAAG